jgi:hypothetical protein
VPYRHKAIHGVTSSTRTRRNTLTFRSAALPEPDDAPITTPPPGSLDSFSVDIAAPGG